MSDNIETAKKMMTAWDNKDEAALRSILHSNYTGKCPMNEYNSDSLVDLMKNSPFTGKSANCETISEGNKLVNIFEWVITAPFQATIPMIEVMTFKDSKVLNSRMYFDTGLFPAEESTKVA